MQEIIDRYCGFEAQDEHGAWCRTTTRVALVAPGSHRRVGEAVRRWGRSTHVALLCDPNTWRVAGHEVAEILTAAGISIERIELGSTGDPVVCDDATIDAVEAAFSRAGAGFAIAVGAGTLNDLAKMAAHRLSLPYACVATAPSMNGYTSSIAAILSRGVKITTPATPPIAVYASPEILAAAPYRMIASGIGDLYSKPVSNADWRLSHRLLGTPHSSIVMQIVEAGATVLDGVAPGLPSRDPGAVQRLAAALMLSGLAMQAAGTSGPASGGEHLISHYIDMTSAAFGESHDFHGCQVAVGTIVTSRLYEFVRGLDPRRIDVDRLVTEHEEWDRYAETLAARFGPLTGAVVEHAKKSVPTRAVLRERLERLLAEWDSIMADVRGTLRPSEELEAELRSAACPTRFSEIGVTPDRAWRAIVLSKDIRARYTILHLAAELGVLASFAEAELARPAPSPF